MIDEVGVPCLRISVWSYWVAAAEGVAKSMLLTMDISKARRRMKDTSLCALVSHQGACLASQILLTFPFYRPVMDLTCYRAVRNGILWLTQSLRVP